MAMDELEISKIVGAGCAALLAFVGFGQLGSALVGVDQLDEPAYRIELPEAEDMAAVAEDEGPMPVGQLMAMAVMDEGPKVFRKCSACHKMDDGANGVGPHLYGVVGRDIGSVDGYAYSDTLMSKEGPWDFAALDGFLEDPKGWAPGTKMGFAGLSKPEDRASVIAWMNEQSANPLPLPPVEAAEVEEVEVASVEREEAAQVEAAIDADAQESQTVESASEEVMEGREAPAPAIEMTNEAAGDVKSADSERLDNEPRPGEVDPAVTAVEQEVVTDGDRGDDGSDVTSGEDSRVVGTEAVVEEPGEEVRIEPETDSQPMAVEEPDRAVVPADDEIVVAEADTDAAVVEDETLAEVVDEAATDETVVVDATPPAEEEQQVAVLETDEPAAEEEAVVAVASAAAVPAWLVGADADKGARVFRRCQACHKVDPAAGNAVGPNLYDVVGRDIGSVDYAYSDALAGKGGVWDFEALNGFLLKPRDWAPGTKMAFPGLRKEQDRADVIAYLNANGENPVDLSE